MRKKLIRQLVEELLEKNSIQAAPVDVEAVARNEQIDVRREAADDDLSGFLLRGPAVPSGWVAIIGVNGDQHPNRQRFSVAHELGHHLLHPGGDLVHVDRDRTFQIKRRDAESSKGTDPEEREANAFAAELLMPEAFLHADLDEVSLVDDSDVGVLAARYGVSQQAFMIRLANLGYRFE